MKKFTKVTLIISGIFFIIGVIILVTCSIIAGGRLRSGLVAAVSSRLHDVLDDGFDFPVVLEDLMDFSDFDYSEDADEDFWDEYLYYSDGIEVHSGSYADDKAAAAADITDLCLSLGNGKFAIAPSKDEYFHIRSGGRGKCQYYTEGSTFYINAFYKSKWYHKNKLTLEIPDMVFENADISIGAGSANISSLKSGTLVIDVGAGELAIENLICEYIETSIGMGSVTVKNGSIQNAGFDIGMGSLEYTGTIDCDLSAVVGMGSMELMLNDSQYNHNYTLDASMGTIKLGDTEYNSFLEYDQDIDNNADSTYWLECDMGSIEVIFNENKSK